MRPALRDPALVGLTALEATSWCLRHSGTISRALEAVKACGPRFPKAGIVGAGSLTSLPNLPSVYVDLEHRPVCPSREARNV